MKTEQEPKEYQPRHHKQISLENYHGLGSDMMELNPIVADNFMRVSDMRMDVLIVKKPDERVQDYDEIGSVKVAKFLKMPRLGEWRGSGITQTRKEDTAAYYVAIDDQELARKVARLGNGNGGSFNDRYINAFGKEVKTGLQSVLKNEKLLNGGKYDYTFMYSYLNFILMDIVAFPLVEAEILLNSPDPASRAEGTALVASFMGVIHLKNQLFNLGSSIIGRFGMHTQNGLEKFHTKHEDPFVRHSIPEYLMPGVPIDRLARGMKYLSDHGDKLVNKI